MAEFDEIQYKYIIESAFDDLLDDYEDDIQKSDKDKEDAYYNDVKDYHMFINIKYNLCYNEDIKTNWYHNNETIRKDYAIVNVKKYINMLSYILSYDNYFQNENDFIFSEIKIDGANIDAEKQFDVNNLPDDFDMFEFFDTHKESGKYLGSVYPYLNIKIGFNKFRKVDFKTKFSKFLHNLYTTINRAFSHKIKKHNISLTLSYENEYLKENQFKEEYKNLDTILHITDFDLAKMYTLFVLDDYEKIKNIDENIDMDDETYSSKYLQNFNKYSTNILKETQDTYLDDVIEFGINQAKSKYGIILEYISNDMNCRETYDNSKNSNYAYVAFNMTLENKDVKSIDINILQECILSCIYKHIPMFNRYSQHNIVCLKTDIKIDNVKKTNDKATEFLKNTSLEAKIKTYRKSAKYFWRVREISFAHAPYIKDSFIIIANKKGDLGIANDSDLTYTHYNSYSSDRSVIAVYDKMLSGEIWKYDNKY